MITDFRVMMYSDNGFARHLLKQLGVSFRRNIVTEKSPATQKRFLPVVEMT